MGFLLGIKTDAYCFGMSKTLTREDVIICSMAAAAEVENWNNLMIITTVTAVMHAAQWLQSVLQNCKH